MRVACVATKFFEDHELQQPCDALRSAGHDVVIVAPDTGEIAGYHGQVKVVPDLGIDDARPGAFDALFIPGGFSPDQLRADARFVRFVEAFDRGGKPIFAICHGPQLLLTAGVLDDRTCTAWRTVQDDLRRAGVNVKDQPVVVDELLVTSRQPQDLPQFCETITRLLERENAGRGTPLQTTATTSPPGL